MQEEEDTSSAQILSGIAQKLAQLASTLRELTNLPLEGFTSSISPTLITDDGSSAVDETIPAN